MAATKITESYKRAWENLVNDENKSEIINKIQHDSIMLDYYTSLEEDVEKKQERLSKLNPIQDTYEYLIANTELERAKRALKVFEDGVLQSKTNLLKIFDQYKYRLTGDVLGGALELIRDILANKSPNTSPNYPKHGRYIWRTHRDDKVRPEHAVREGLIFSFSNPPHDGNPGEQNNCRCWAEIIPDNWETGLGKIFKK